jgi:hypothetical protein
MAQIGQIHLDQKVEYQEKFEKLMSQIKLRDE